MGHLYHGYVSHNQRVGGSHGSDPPGPIDFPIDFPSDFEHVFFKVEPDFKKNAHRKGQKKPDVDVSWDVHLAKKKLHSKLALTSW